MANSFVAGATVFLTKPFNPEQFQTTLRILLTSKLSIKELISKADKAMYDHKRRKKLLSVSQFDF